MNANYTIDLDEYETLFEIRRLHCGPSLCIRRVSDGVLLNLVLLSNIAFTDLSFQVFLEEIDKISKIPPHPSIVRFIGLSKPNPKLFNSVGICYEYFPKCFSLESIIGDLAPGFTKTNDVNLTNNNLMNQENQTKEQNKDDRNDDQLNQSQPTFNETKIEEKSNEFDEPKIEEKTDEFDEPKIEEKNDEFDEPKIEIEKDNDFNEQKSGEKDDNSNEDKTDKNLNLIFPDSQSSSAILNRRSINYSASDDNISMHNAASADNFDEYNQNSPDNDLNFVDSIISNDNDANFDNAIDSGVDNDSELNMYRFYGNNNSSDLNFDDGNSNFDSSNNNFDGNSGSFDSSNNASNAEIMKFDDGSRNDNSDISFNKSSPNSEKKGAKAQNNKSKKQNKSKAKKNESLFSTEQTLILLYGISNAICYLHQHDVVFMNLSISNILIDENLEPKIQYYGITSLFEYFTLCCCPPVGLNYFHNQTNEAGIVGNFIANFSNVKRNLTNDYIITKDEIRIINSKFLIPNIRNRSHYYLMKNLSEEYFDSPGLIPPNPTPESRSFLERHMKDLIFVSPEVLKGQIPDKKSDVYAFSYLLFLFCSQENTRWILGFDCSYIVNICRGNRLILKSSIPVLARLLINQSWDNNPDCRPNPSEVNWIIDQLGYFFFNAHEYLITSNQRSIKFRKYQQFKDKLPTFKRERNSYLVKSNAKMMYDAVNQLSISANGKNYAKSVIQLQNLLQSLRSYNLYDILDIIVLNTNENVKENETGNNKKNSKRNKKNKKQVPQEEEQTRETNENCGFYNFEPLNEFDFEMKKFNQLYFLTTKEGIYSLALNITVACTSRFKKIFFYAQLVSELYHCYSSKYPKLLKLKKYLFSFFLTSLANYCAYPNSLPIVALIFYCLQLHVYDINEMISSFDYFYEKYKNEKKISISIIFCWFCPEIESASIELYNKMFELVKTQCQYDYFPFAFKKFISRIDEYRKNDWILYHNLRSDKDTNDLAYSLRKDNLTVFQDFLVQNRKIINGKIDPDIFVPCIYAHHYPTTLMYAALYGSIRCSLFLIKSGARAGSWDRKYRLLPSYSIAGGDITIFANCLQGNRGDDSLMQTAAQFHRNYLFYKSYLIDKNLLTSMDKFGKSVMSAAAGSNNVSILIFSFVQKSCRENFVESFGRTPLHVAAEQEMVDVLRVLLFLSNDELALDENSLTEAELTSEINSNENQNSNKKAQQKAASKTKKKDGKEASEISDSDDEIKPKIDHIVDINAKDSWGMTPLHLAADKMKTKSVEILFTSPNIDVNIKNNSGKSAVYYAVKTGNIKLIKLFLKNPNVDFCCKTKKGKTPLHAAVKMKRPDIVRLLIKNKPMSIYIPDCQNMSPFELAASSNISEIAEIFHSYIMKKFDEQNANSKQIEIVDGSQNDPENDSYKNKDENDSLDDKNANKTEEVMNITNEIPFIDINASDDNDDINIKSKKRRKEDKDCNIF